jgi:hypothetical protein
MKNANQILKTIMTKLGMDIKLEQMMLMDGVTKIEADVFEAGAEVFIVTEDDQRIPLPVGEYELESGMILIVTQEGIIAEIKEAEQEEETEEVVEEVPVEADQSTAVSQAQPKSIIESTSREYKFTIEEMEAKILELEAKIVELTKVEEVELEAEPKPIVHNPENKEEENVILFGKNKPMTKLDKIFKMLNEN